MKKKLARNKIQLVICDTPRDISNSNCKQCPYFTKKGECNLRKDIEIVFVFAPTPAPIPTANEWIKTTYNLYCKDKDVCSAFFNGYTVVTDVKREKMGIARCRKEDKFDGATGIAIAYARLRGLPVHPEYVSKKDKVLGRDD